LDVGFEVSNVSGIRRKPLSPTRVPESQPLNRGEPERTELGERSGAMTNNAKDPFRHLCAGGERKNRRERAQPTRSKAEGGLMRESSGSIGIIWLQTPTRRKKTMNGRPRTTASLIGPNGIFSNLGRTCPSRVIEKKTKTERRISGKKRALDHKREKKGEGRSR